MRRYIAEFLGTAFLLMSIVGAGVMAEKLSAGNAGVALLGTSIAIGGALLVIIQCLGPISGAHLNPIVSLLEVFWGRLKKRELLGYCTAQFLGAILGVFLVHAMFGLKIIQISTNHRAAWGFWLSEFIATFGLICIIALPGRKHVEWVPVSIAVYIIAACWFTSSASFVNPAVTVARSLTNTFCGLAPAGVIPFIIAQTLGGLAAYFLVNSIQET